MHSPEFFLGTFLFCTWSLPGRLVQPSYLLPPLCQEDAPVVLGLSLGLARPSSTPQPTRSQSTGLKLDWQDPAWALCCVWFLPTKPSQSTPLNHWLRVPWFLPSRTTRVEWAACACWLLVPTGRPCNVEFASCIHSHSRGYLYSNESTEDICQT